MKTVYLTAAAAAFFVAATPAVAQDAIAAPSGARAELLVGYDAVRISLDDFGIDDSAKDDGIFFGVGAGYDFAVANGTSVGLDVELTESTIEEGSDEEGQVSAGRDIYAGGRVSFAVSPAANVYLKAGYTNLRVKAELEGTSDSANADGFRLGAGAQFNVGSNAYVGGEYRYSNYEADLTRHQFAAVLGVRF